MTTPLTLWRRPGLIWNSGAYVSAGLPIGIITFTFVVTLLSLSAGLLVTFLFALPVAWLGFAIVKGFSAMERSRARALMDVDIDDPVPPLTRRTWLGRLSERVRSRQRWTQIGYHLLHLLTGSLGFAVVTAVWGGSIAMLGLPLYRDLLPNDAAEFHFFTIDDTALSLAAAGVGLLGVVLVAPWATVWTARAQVGLAARMLGSSGDAELRAEIGRLETSRTAAVDSAESERRRIERDLHDGAQQRLVALAANLGSAREKLDDDPERSRELLVDAHEEAKAALREIRDLVRGIHPVILEDRGLDAALSAVVARSPIPVDLRVDITRRPPAAVESAAYFIVSEALTNIARHSRASRASIGIARAGERLIIEVHDNGVGGANADAGSGLHGLRERVHALGGSMHVISPSGGPTTISVELPCGS